MGSDDTQALRRRYQQKPANRDALAAIQHRLGLALRRKVQVEAHCILATDIKGLKIYGTNTSHSHRRCSEFGQHRFHSTVRRERL